MTRSIYDLFRALVDAASGTPQYVQNNHLTLEGKKVWHEVIDRAEALNLFSTAARNLGEEPIPDEPRKDVRQVPASFLGNGAWMAELPGDHR